MTGKLKTIGLALVASLLASAALAQAAQAEGQLHSSAAPTTLSAAQTTAHKFTVGGGFSVTCTTATFAGTSSATTEAETTLTPTYSGCTDPLGRTVHVGTVCAVVLIWASYLPPQVQIPVRIACTVGVLWGFYVTNASKSVVCTVTVGSQSGIKSVGITNLGGTKGVELNFNLTNLTATASGGLLNCGIANGTYTNGAYTGKSVMTGKNAEGKAVELRAE